MTQWRNRRGGGGGGGRAGGQSAPQRLLTRKFLLTYREKRGKEKRERGKNWEKEKVENWKWKAEKLQNEERTFFFFASNFSKALKFVLGLPKWKFSTGKKHFTLGKKTGKNDFAPSEKFSCYAPAVWPYVTDL